MELRPGGLFFLAPGRSFLYACLGSRAQPAPLRVVPAPLRALCSPHGVRPSSSSAGAVPYRARPHGVSLSTLLSLSATPFLTSFSDQARPGRDLAEPRLCSHPARRRSSAKLSVVELLRLCSPVQRIPPCSVPSLAMDA
ncbi:hypothetical protein Zm00014a_006880 [Zea mays]|uniref:Uncharacterized protein n=1 Tax=Zea mays TaxID=4577 RepID=A0A3L6FN93_MAIZE|nr:hypothetical protein Zm00014a_006880 [Zea mays]